MAQSEYLSMILIDGTANGRIKCTISKWIIAFKIPRDKLEDCKVTDVDELKELKHSGIYFLLGENEIYVGQAGTRINGEGILKRISEHNKKNYWDEVIIFTASSNDFLGYTEISSLENKFFRLAVDTGRYKVINRKEPLPGNPNAEQKISIEKFAEYVQMVMLIWGYKVFEPIKKNPPVEEIEIPSVPKNQQPKKNENSIFYLKRNGNDKYATCKRTSDKYIVLAGSKIDPQLTEKDVSKNVIDKRNYIKENLQLTKDYILLIDIDFDSPTAAAEFVTGVSTNGKLDWKNENGITLKEIKEKNQ